MELRAELRTYEESLGSVGNASTCSRNEFLTVLKMTFETTTTE
jgi:hypothetical protein